MASMVSSEEARAATVEGLDDRYLEACTAVGNLILAKAAEGKTELFTSRLENETKEVQKEVISRLKALGYRVQYYSGDIEMWVPSGHCINWGPAPKPWWRIWG